MDAQFQGFLRLKRTAFMSVLLEFRQIKQRQAIGKNLSNYAAGRKDIHRWVQN